MADLKRSTSMASSGASSNAGPPSSASGSNQAPEPKWVHTGQAQQGALAQLMTKQKLDEAKRAQQSQLAYQNYLTGQPTVGAEITPATYIAIFARIRVGILIF